MLGIFKNCLFGVMVSITEGVEQIFLFHQCMSGNCTLTNVCACTRAHTHSFIYIHTETYKQTCTYRLTGKMRMYVYKWSQWPFSFTMNHGFCEERTQAQKTFFYVDVRLHLWSKGSRALESPVNAFGRA